MIINVHGMDLSPEEIRSFQAVFPRTPASSVMNKIIQRSMEYWNKVSMNPTASDAAMRQAQGALLCLVQIDEDVKGVLQFDLDSGKDDNVDAKEESDGGPDIF